MNDQAVSPKHEVSFWFDSHGELVPSTPSGSSTPENTTVNVVIPCRYGNGAAWHTDVAHDYLIALYVVTRLPQLESWSCSEESRPDETGGIASGISCIILRSKAPGTDDVASVLNELIGLFRDGSDDEEEDDRDLSRTEALSEFEGKLCAGDVPIPKNLGQLADVFMEYLLLGEAELRSSDGVSP